MNELKHVIPEQDYEDNGLTPSYNVAFPGGNVQIIQTTGGNFWVHINANRSPIEGEQRGEIKAARLDCTGKSVADMNVGDFNNPDLYHLAVLIEPGERFGYEKLLEKNHERN